MIRLQCVIDIDKSLEFNRLWSHDGYFIWHSFIFWPSNIR